MTYEVRVEVLELGYGRKWNVACAETLVTTLEEARGQVGENAMAVKRALERVGCGAEWECPCEIEEVV